MGCELFSDPNDRQLCSNLFTCLVQPTHPGTSLTGPCIGQGGDLYPCWCGTNRTTCLTDDTPPTQANGPCLQQIFAAAKSTTASVINQRFIDPTFPLGAAVNLAQCRATFCACECAIPTLQQP